MSTVTEVFYGIKCDYPDCKTMYEGDEYTYYGDESDAAEYASDNDWLVGFEGKDYCPAHVVIDYTLEGEGPDGPEDEFRCRRPLGESITEQLEALRRRVIEHAHVRLDALAWQVNQSLSPGGTFARITDNKLTKVHQRACRGWKPGITQQEIFDLRNGAGK